MRNLKSENNKKIKEAHLLLIKKLAWSFHRTTGIEWNELFAQASLLYWMARLEYNSKKNKGAKKTTFIYKFIQNELIHFLRKEKRYEQNHIQDDTIDISFYQTPFFELFDALSPDSQSIVEMILNDPTEYAKLPGKMARGLVVKNLKKTKDWSYSRCWESLASIRLELMKL
jgi:hypothetical protein